MNVNITECICINRNEDKKYQKYQKSSKKHSQNVFFFQEKQNRQLNVEQSKVK